MQQRFFIAVLIAVLISCSTCFGHHYVHHQELNSIIPWLLPVVFRAVVFKLLVWCGAEGYVSGLQDAAASVVNNFSFFMVASYISGSAVCKLIHVTLRGA